MTATEVIRKSNRKKIIDGFRYNNRSIKIFKVGEEYLAIEKRYFLKLPLIVKRTKLKDLQEVEDVLQGFKFDNVSRLI
ncbi:MAG: hypothetical protein AB1521_08225 [Bacteroidota bacterium]